MPTRSGLLMRIPRRGSGARQILVAVAAGLFACSGSGSDVVAPPLSAAASIAITPSSPVVTVGAQLALRAEVHDPDGRTVAGATVFWSSLDSSIVTVTSTGVVTGMATGTTQVAASSGGESAVVPIAVLAVPVASIAVAPATANVTVGGTVALTAVAYDATGQVLTGRQIVWATSVPQVAKVGASGTVTGVAAGVAVITATSEGKTASATVTASPVPVASVAVTPSSAALVVGQSVSLSAVATDSHGSVLSGRTVAWSVLDQSIATVTSLGVVTAVGAGTTTVNATSEGKTGAATVTVQAPLGPVVGSVQINPAAVTLHRNQSRVLTAKVLDAKGKQLNGRTVTWTSSDSTVITLAVTGPLTATVSAATGLLGATVITATSSGVSGTSVVTLIP